MCRFDAHFNSPELFLVLNYSVLISSYSLEMSDFQSLNLIVFVTFFPSGIISVSSKFLFSVSLGLSLSWFRLPYVPKV